MHSCQIFSFNPPSYSLRQREQVVQLVPPSSPKDRVQGFVHAFHTNDSLCLRKQIAEIIFKINLI